MDSHSKFKQPRSFRSINEKGDLRNSLIPIIDSVQVVNLTMTIYVNVDEGLTSVRGKG